MSNLTSFKNNQEIHKAIIFATKKHAGKNRKGTDLPYIIHPLETLSIIEKENPSIELALAAVLHDTLEDTDTTYEELVENFGKRCAKLVASHSEQKEENGVKLPWRVRKEKALADLKNDELEVKQLVLADSISNLRSMYYDLQEVGTNLWERFNTHKEEISWFYHEKIAIFQELEQYENIASDYQEYCWLVKQVFED